VTSNPGDLRNLAVGEFVSRTAAKEPVPGGGSVGCVVAALGVALGEMALAYSRGRKSLAAHEAEHARIGAHLEHLRVMFLDLVNEDAAAFEQYQVASKAPAGAQRDAAMQDALSLAVNVPRVASKSALALLGELRDLIDRCNPRLMSDLLASAALGAAAVRLCDYNVRANTPEVADAEAAAEVRNASASDVARSEALLQEIETRARSVLP
jgi:methenyltetrahydrofolate cyclohydrolase